MAAKEPINISDCAVLNGNRIEVNIPDGDHLESGKIDYKLFKNGATPLMVKLTPKVQIDVMTLDSLQKEKADLTDKVAAKDVEIAKWNELSK